MNTIRAFFPKIRATFSIFKKGQGRPPPPFLPPSCAPVSFHVFSGKRNDKRYNWLSFSRWNFSNCILDYIYSKMKLIFCNRKTRLSILFTSNIFYQVTKVNLFREKFSLNLSGFQIWRCICTQNLMFAMSLNHQSC